MTMTDRDGAADHSLSSVIAVARRNAGSGGEIAVAAGQVIAKRVALGMKAAFDPLGADHVEFARMVPEKVEAFSAAGMIMLTQSGAANRHLTRTASDEVMNTARATLAMADCLSPAALAQAQSAFALAWMSRAAAHFIAMGKLALEAQEAAMAPIRQTLTANVARLGG
jgi:hypothetical protein